ncbi:MAG TPA: alginate lyase family protein [Chitinophagaceae bacterium]|jgi:hypothetical protein
MRKICFLLLAITVAASALAQYVSLNNSELGKLKELIRTDAEVKQLYSAFQRSAAQALNVPPNPIDTISTEGRLKGDPKKTATSNALWDMYKIYSLALVYRVEGDKNYLQKAVAYLTAWATVNRSKGDPIDDTNLDDAIAGYDLIKVDMDAAGNQLIVKWLSQVAEAEIGSFTRRPNSGTATNNWNSHRLKVVGEIAWTINSPGYQSFVSTELKRQVARNLYPDGSGIDFKTRDALHYHVYDMEPFLKLAIVLKRATGEDYYSYTSETQSSIKKSTEWLVPFLTGEKTHEEFVHSTVRFDSLRAANGEAGYKAGTLFDPLNGLKTLALAAYFDPQYITTYKAVKKTGKAYPDWQLVLDKVMQ